MINFMLKYHTRLTTALFQHLSMLITTMIISVIFASLITLALIAAPRRVQAAILRVFGAIYAIPSLALFSILIPFLGIGFGTAVFVLSLYNQFLLIRNFVTGLDSVDAILVEAARGMGMTDFQILLKIKIPLAFPVIMGGIRLAVISTIGIGTIAAVINAGGIGALLFDGLRTVNPVKIIWGTILAGGLAVSANVLLGAVERAVRKRIYYQETT
jgi:osmoprotectant transport system permease protein